MVDLHSDKLETMTGSDTNQEEKNKELARAKEVSKAVKI
jgi:hypothetical protein